ncbi:hypothetical protein CONPUDRAFT_169383 [Coniophora puteana RWD-64-598 SS2]|uniref:F-box domain-containing protein n=1 Tax=Coniophora puteana (strain RWD-64-598) TaxID=741705 RepID=A0A5M3MAA9_CONPW|nr:uncharacterized protein CONPUDRAFT_169383 [Coniophora puteana RWD-64-598 SS2]EIW75581.1 hypothetical protein CONPUDRAFT_169383 [Coniophora puteana RWD-64-598 SS2]
MAPLSLPAELLMIIFEECVSYAHAHDGLAWQFHVCKHRCLSWIRVTHVCRHWRSVALEHPRLWSSIVMAPGRRGKRLTEAMIARSAGARLSLSFSSKKAGDESNLIQHLGYAKEVVLRGYSKSFMSLLGELDARHDPPRQDILLESLSLTHFRAGPHRSVNNSISGCRIFNGSKLRRLHLGFFTLGRHLPGFLEGMTNLQELSLSSTIYQSQPIEPKISLPSLLRLHMEDPVHCCKAFIDSLDLSRPLDYIGIDSINRGTEVSAFFLAVREILSSYHVMGMTVSNPSTLLDSAQYHSALYIKSERHASGCLLFCRTTVSVAYWPVDVAHTAQGIAHVTSGLDASSDRAEIAPAALSALLESCPATFIRSVFRSNFVNVSSKLFNNLPVQSVICAVIDDSFSANDNIKERTEVLLSEIPSLQHLEIGRGSLLGAIDALHPANDPSEDILVPQITHLVLSSVWKKEVWVYPLVSCIIARAERGYPLQQLSVRGRMKITAEEWKALQEVPVTLSWDDVSYS